MKWDVTTPNTLEFEVGDPDKIYERSNSSTVVSIKVKTKDDIVSSWLKLRYRFLTT